MIRRPLGATLFIDSTVFLFFFNDTATTEIYTLSLHDALPIFERDRQAGLPLDDLVRGRLELPGLLLLGQHHLRLELLEDRKSPRLNSSHAHISYAVFCLKKKNHTSELQSRQYLVFRLLLVLKT